MVHFVSEIFCIGLCKKSEHTLPLIASLWFTKCFLPLTFPLRLGLILIFNTTVEFIQAKLIFLFGFKYFDQLDLKKNKTKS